MDTSTLSMRYHDQLFHIALTCMKIGAMLVKLLLGGNSQYVISRYTPIQTCITNLRSVWNSSRTSDHGIERLIRLFLALSVFVLPGVYFKQLFYNQRSDIQGLFTDAYVVAKLLLPIAILSYEQIDNWFFHALQIILILETMLYIPMQIFASDFFSKPPTYRRSLLLLFVNYVELVFGYAVLYSMPNTMNREFSHWFDAVYYSAITAATIGYGDYYPISVYGKVIVSMQSMAFLVFGVLFVSFFASRIEHNRNF